MKKLIASALCLAILPFVACHKDHISGPSTTTDSTTTLGTMNIDLLNGGTGWLDTAKINIELIISETGGKVLLDTITPANTLIKAALATNASTVDLTNIYYDPSSQFYNIQTYKGINPSGWTHAYRMSYISPTGIPTATQQQTLIYTHIPSTTTWVFSAVGTPGSSANVTPTTATETYQAIPGNYAYAMIMDLGLYKMAKPTHNNDTIDCSTMDTLTPVTFNSSSYFSWAGTTLNGYTDSTNLNSMVYLYGTAPYYNFPQCYYPKKYIQKYSLFTSFNHNNQELVYDYSFGSSIDSNITYPDPNSYTFSSKQNNQFTVSCSASTPTCYTSSWSGNNFDWTLYSSPDSTTINPLGLLTAQKAKMLQGQSLSNLSLYSFESETVDAYNYGGLMGLVHDSAKVRQSPVAKAVIYSKAM